MLDRKVKVRSVRSLGARNYLLSLAAAEQARLARPGQFVMLKCSHELEDNPLLRRPFSIFDTRPQARTGRPGGLDLLVKDVGTGSHRLASLGPGEEIHVLGPQGKPFGIHPEMKHRVQAACLVAGGVGIAALYLLARQLLAAGIPAALFYGGRSEEDLVLREYFEQLGIQVHCTTEDGSRGERGFVTAALDRFLRGRTRGSVVAFACGPWAMMKAVHELAAHHRVPCEVSLEARMGCSLGACMGCVIRARTGEGEHQYIRVCLEGPVMDSRLVDWDTIPL